jgi:hypothetical protein
MGCQYYQQVLRGAVDVIPRTEHGFSPAGKRSTTVGIQFDPAPQQFSRPGD